jgi:hypothetical protein
VQVDRIKDVPSILHFFVVLFYFSWP